MNKEEKEGVLHLFVDEDPTASSRKKDHIEMALKSQMNSIDSRFNYEPVLSAHPGQQDFKPFAFLDKEIRNPLWVSSMTGGTKEAKTINQNLAKACRDFGFGMGLGSCRLLLRENTYLPDFDVRSIIGDDLPLYGNLGIAQVEQLIASNETGLINDMVDRLKADGLIIHINPLQEWLQPEGDILKARPLDTIRRLLDTIRIPIIVKEVGQGMGPESLRELLQLPLKAIAFGAHGGTNFSKLELLRSSPIEQDTYGALSAVGHTAEEMVQITNKLEIELGDKLLCKEIIVSGGVKNFLDGYYLISSLNLKSVYGQASSFLKHARGSYEELYNYVDAQVKGLHLAKKYLRVKNA